LRCSAKSRTDGDRGEDFGDYKQWLSGRRGHDARQQVPKSSPHVLHRHGEQRIASFYTGAMADAGQLSFRNAKDARLAIISPNDPGAMVTYAEECAR
jgi:adenosine kinase